MRKTQVCMLVLVAFVCTWGSKAEAQKPKPPASAKPDANGAVGAEAGKVAAAAASPTMACLELHNGGAIFSFSLTINPDAYPFKVTGGKVKGTLCDAANWKITGGSLSGTPLIKAQYTGSASCAKTLAVNGAPHPQPPSWGGTYVFDGTATFNHQTLFLGYMSCP